MRPTSPRTSLSPVLLTFLGLSILSGCTTTTSQAMLPAELVVVATHPHSVAVRTEGTPRRFGFGPPLVSSEVLQSSIEEAILKCELFDGIASDAQAGYVLKVTVKELQKPESGLDMTARVSLTWALSEASSRKTIWMETVTTSSTASTIESSQLSDRLQASIEGALRKNIARGLNHLSHVELPHTKPVE